MIFISHFDLCKRLSYRQLLGPYRAISSQCLTALFLSCKIAQPHKGPVAQLGARINRTDEVAGSNPARSTKGFLKKSGPMAQLGARLNGIEKVVGSSPTGSTKN